ncbi:MAG: hypothetical protein M1816_004636 [Peltula sp. TS41687]|nr:MAG: hypothetical protein M1816_004636 [Peltula sp. TS41687]
MRPLAILFYEMYSTAVLLKFDYPRYLPYHPIAKSFIYISPFTPQASCISTASSPRLSPSPSPSTPTLALPSTPKSPYGFVNAINGIEKGINARFHAPPSKPPFVNAVDSVEQGISSGFDAMGDFINHWFGLRSDHFKNDFIAQMLLTHLVGVGTAVTGFAVGGPIIGPIVGVGGGLLVGVGSMIIAVHLEHGDALPDAEDDAQLSRMIRLAKAKGMKVQWGQE